MTCHTCDLTSMETFYLFILQMGGFKVIMLSNKKYYFIFGILSRKRGKRIRNMSNILNRYLIKTIRKLIFPQHFDNEILKYTHTQASTYWATDKSNWILHYEFEVDLGK